MQKRKLEVWLPLLFSIVMIAGMFIGYQLKDNVPGKSMFSIEKRKPVEEVIDLVKSKYVDDVNIDTLTTNAVSAMLGKLDPHSVFMPAGELQQVEEELAGKFYGIGIEFNILSDTINVINVVEGGPAERAGIRTGDKLLKADDSAVAGVKITADKIRGLLKGAAGTNAVLTVLRGVEQKQFTIAREGIPLYSLDAAYIIAPGVGFIRLNKFSETTYVEFMHAAEKLKKAGMQSLILDLRDNGGGILTEATEIADEFLDSDKLITYTEGVHSPRKEYRCKRQGVFEKGKLVLLVNENTASASEVLTGALQDWDRATVVGRRTFGKGLVQEQFVLSDGSGLRLTVARYYTPLGRSIQKSYSNGSADYMNEVNSRFKAGEMFNVDSIRHDKNAATYKTPGGKTVFGAGGITPDVFVPSDTIGFNKAIAMLYIKGIINNFSYTNYINHQSAFAPYTSPALFQKNYTVDDNTWNSFKAYAAADSVFISDISSKEKAQISNQLKWLTARQIWHLEGFYEVADAEDPMVLKGLEEVNRK